MEFTSSTQLSQTEIENKENVMGVGEKFIVTIGKFLGIGIASVGITTGILYVIVDYLFKWTTLLDNINATSISIIIFLLTTVFILILSFLFTKKYSQKREIIFISVEIIVFSLIPFLIRIYSFGFYF